MALDVEAVQAFLQSPLGGYVILGFGFLVPGTLAVIAAVLQNALAFANAFLATLLVAFIGFSANHRLVAGFLIFIALSDLLVFVGRHFRFAIQKGHIVKFDLADSHKRSLQHTGSSSTMNGSLSQSLQELVNIPSQTLKVIPAFEHGERGKLQLGDLPPNQTITAGA